MRGACIGELSRQPLDSVRVYVHGSNVKLFRLFDLKGFTACGGSIRRSRRKSVSIYSGKIFSLPNRATPIDFPE